MYVGWEGGVRSPNTVYLFKKGEGGVRSPNTVYLFKKGEGGVRSPNFCFVWGWFQGGFKSSFQKMIQVGKKKQRGETRFSYINDIMRIFGI